MALLAALVCGCMRPLALQDEYFSSTSRSSENANADTLGTVRHHQALQAVRHACRRRARSAAAAGGDAGSPFAPAALARLCASEAAHPRPVSAHGSMSNAYRRWVEDDVRELPDASDTAASAGGG